jgi:hypothetical protein
MDEMRIIRARTAIFERGEPPRGRSRTCATASTLYDERDNMVEVLGRVADLAVAHAAFEAAVAKYPAKRICIREGCRGIRRYDEPRG